MRWHISFMGLTIPPFTGLAAGRPHYFTMYFNLLTANDPGSQLIFTNN
jgi:hypothetical protein